jgi:hypothetical protein
MTDAAIHPVRRHGYWLPGAALLACGFLAGALCGGSLVARHVLNKIQKGIEYPESRVEETVMRMSRSLDLTPEQEQKIRKVLTTQDQELIALRKQIWPKVTARLEQTEKEIGEMLNADQREKWRDRIGRDRQQWGPPGGPGGMRPPPAFGEGRHQGEGRMGEGRPGDGRMGEGRPGDGYQQEPGRRPPRGSQPRDPAGPARPRPNGGPGAGGPNPSQPENGHPPPPEFPPDGAPMPQPPADGPAGQN